MLLFLSSMPPLKLLPSTQPAARLPTTMPPAMCTCERHANPLDIYPNQQMTPVRVTELQLEALQQGSGRLFWRFMSPEGKRETGVLRPSRRPYLVPPKYADLPLFDPLMHSTRFEVIGALAVGHDRYQCRARVYPKGGERECAGDPMPSPPLEYIWQLTKQPLVRPSCYEDDPLQQGISTGPPFGGCWLVDNVRLDERHGGGGGDRPPTNPKGGDNAQRKQLGLRVRRGRALVMKSSDRPTIPELPGGVASVDGLSAEMIKGFDADDLQRALENLEVAIFDSPPFEKENEVARRRNLALAYWLKDDPSFYPRLIPNAKEVLRQLKGNDAEMQFILGKCTLATMEGDTSQAFAIRAIERALELDPEYVEAQEGLAQAKSPPDEAAATALADAAPDATASDATAAAALVEPMPPPLADAAPDATVSDATAAAALGEPMPPPGFEWGAAL